MRVGRSFSPEFKVRVVLEVLTGAKSHAEACREYALKDSLLSAWKRTFTEQSVRAFQSDERESRERARTVELERLARRQALEIEILKKASAMLGSSRDGGCRVGQKLNVTGGIGRIEGT